MKDLDLLVRTMKVQLDNAGVKIESLTRLLNEERIKNQRLLNELQQARIINKSQ